MENKIDMLDAQTITLSGTEATIDTNDIYISNNMSSCNDPYSITNGFYNTIINTVQNNTYGVHSNGISMSDECDITIGDRSLKDFMSNVEEHLAILKPRTDLEEKYDQLRQLRNQYETLKQEIVNQEKIIEILKK